MSNTCVWSSRVTKEEEKIRLMCTRVSRAFLSRTHHVPFLDDQSHFLSISQEFFSYPMICFVLFLLLFFPCLLFPF